VTVPDAILHKRLSAGQVRALLAGAAVAWPVELAGKTVGVLLTVEGAEPVPTNDTTAAGAAEGEGDE
jgi:hypothetical protein